MSQLQDIIGLTEEQFFGFFLTLIRITALVSVAPLFGSQAVPSKVKLFMSLFMTIAILPVIKTEIHLSSLTFIAFFPMILKEMLIGLFLGFNTKFLFESFSFTGKVISHQMGLGVAEMMDPASGDRATPIGNIYGFVAIVLFLLLNGHHIILSAVYKSFELMPVANTAGLSPAARIPMLEMFSELFTIGIKLAAPCMAMVFLVEVSTGIMARIAPQMNIFFIGLPLRLGIGLFGVFASIPLFYLFLQSIMSLWKRDVRGLLSHF